MRIQDWDLICPKKLSIFFDPTVLDLFSLLAFQSLLTIIWGVRIALFKVHEQTGEQAMQGGFGQCEFRVYRDIWAEGKKPKNPETNTQG